MKAVKVFLVFLFSLTMRDVFSQDSASIQKIKIPNFIQLEKDTIVNAGRLETFFEKLSALAKRKNQINILHIGDSHIQADFLTNKIRQLFQNEFGNAGRGIIFPGRLALTNEPMNIRSSSNSVWESKRIVFTDNPLPIGIGAATLKTEQDNAKFSIRLKNNPSLNYSSSDLIFFFKKDSASYNLTAKDSTGNELAYIGAFANDQEKNFSRIHLPYPTNFLELEAHRSAAYQNHFTLFGISFTNSKPGIVYHSIGGNGAKFKHYLSSSYFFEQTKELSPDLIIISLGTNEAVDFPQIDKNLSDQIDQFLKQINTCNPDVPVLITTPFDFYKSKTKRNPGVEEIRTLLLKKPVAIWDGYEIGGGKHSADKWKKNKLLQTDGIHATKEGYELQALLLYQALMKSYKNYVQHRHP